MFWNETISSQMILSSEINLKGSAMKIAVAGTGYVGLSLAVLLSQHNEVHALDIVPEKVEVVSRKLV